MTPTAIRILQVGLDAVALPPGAASAVDYGPFESVHCTPDQAWQRLAAERFDLLLVADDWPDWQRSACDLAVVLWRPQVSPAECIAWLQDGAQDVLAGQDFSLPTWPQRLRAAVERQRVRNAARHAFATDVHTGLPHEGQLAEHMSHLLALREREPAPMALLVFRIEGLATTQARLGAEAAGALRRKVAVRLRAGVRASDVVASLGEDSFAVLLSMIDAPGDADRVGRKLLLSLGETFKVAGQDVAVATALGIAAYPGDGNQPDVLLRRAAALAAAAPASGRVGHSNFVEAGGSATGAATGTVPGGAANDE